MRLPRWLTVLLLLIATILPVLGSEGPPVVPEHKRARLKNSGVEAVGSLFRHTDAAEAAASDITVLSTIEAPEKLKYYRYLTVHNLPPAMRLDGIKLVAMVTNSLSRNPDLILPAVGGPENIIIRVDLFQLRIDPKVWDKFGDKDPYFHQTILKQEVVTQVEEEIEYVQTNETYLASDGKYYYKQVPKKKTATTVTEPVAKVAAAAWLNTKAMTTLIDKCQSSSPILRADWFIVFASIPPAYYDFLGFKTLKEYLEFTAFDKRAKIKEGRATVVLSGDEGLCPHVAENNRILERIPTIWGAQWQTYDFKTSIGANNVVNNFLEKKRDAGEYIGNGPNGLQYYFLVNGNDDRVDEGDIKVVGDSMSYDHRVITGRSCIWCHSKGINPFKSNFQLQVGYRPDQSNLGLYDKDPKKALELQDRIQRLLGTPDWPRIVKDDGSRYNASVKLLTGWESEEMAAHFKKHWDRYQFDRLEMKDIVWEVGYVETDIKALMALRLDGRDDGVLIQQLLQPPIAIRRDHWEESFPRVGLLSTLLQKQPPKVPGK